MTADALYARTRGGNRRRTYKPTKAQLRRMRVVVFTRGEFTCQGCGKTAEIEPGWDGSQTLYIAGEDALEPLHLDHIVPYRDGGRFEEPNLRALCQTCNCSRGARPALPCQH